MEKQYAQKKSTHNKSFIEKYAAAATEDTLNETQFATMLKHDAVFKVLQKICALICMF
jgi:hypothetical protein